MTDAFALQFIMQQKHIHKPELIGNYLSYELCRRVVLMWLTGCLLFWMFFF